MATGLITIKNGTIHVERAYPPGGFYEAVDKEEAKKISSNEKSIEKARRLLKEHIAKIDCGITIASKKLLSEENVTDSIFDVVSGLLNTSEALIAEIYDIITEVITDSKCIQSNASEPQKVDIGRVAWKAFYRSLQAVNTSSELCNRLIRGLTILLNECIVEKNEDAADNSEISNYIEQLETLRIDGEKINSDIDALDIFTSAVQQRSDLDNVVMARQFPNATMLNQCNGALIAIKHRLGGLLTELDNVLINVMSNATPTYSRK